MTDINEHMEVSVESSRIKLAETERKGSHEDHHHFLDRGFVERPTTITPTDIRMMSRCIELSRQASSKGEFPFAALIVRGDKVISEALNEVNRQSDITRHAELLAISKAQQVLGKARLAGCTIYSNIEPCPMCSFPIREARLGRLVFGMASPLMGGFSRWNLLADGRISEVMPEAFGPPLSCLQAY